MRIVISYDSEGEIKMVVGLSRADSAPDRPRLGDVYPRLGVTFSSAPDRSILEVDASECGDESVVLSLPSTHRVDTRTGRLVEKAKPSQG